MFKGFPLQKKLVSPKLRLKSRILVKSTVIIPVWGVLQKARLKGITVEIKNSWENSRKNTCRPLLEWEPDPSELRLKFKKQAKTTVKVRKRL